MDEQKVAELNRIVRECNHIVFFGGAGVSTESGIPDFRSKDGLYNQHDVKFDRYSPEYLLSIDCLVDHPDRLLLRHSMQINLEKRFIHLESSSFPPLLFFFQLHDLICSLVHDINEIVHSLQRVSQQVRDEVCENLKAKAVKMFGPDGNEMENCPHASEMIKAVLECGKEARPEAGDVMRLVL